MEGQQIIEQYFSDYISRIEKSISPLSNQSSVYQSVFNGMDDDLFVFLLEFTRGLPPKTTDLIPSWPPEQVRTQSTSDLSLHECVLEAAAFWQAVKRWTSRLGAGPLSDLRVADYGAGWGRLTRFFGKDVPDSRLYSFEPNPDFRLYYASCKVPGVLVPTDWASEEPLAAHGEFDVIYCFSILTHSSDALTRRIADRWRELTRSGSLVFATIRPKYFLDGGQGDASLFNGADRKLLETQFEAGELVYRSYDGSQDWGVSVAGERYLRSVFGPHFELIGFNPLLPTPNQLIAILMRL